MLRLIPVAITLLAVTTASFAGPAATAPHPVLIQQGDLPDLKDVTDGSTRWLRSTQNPEDGSYGGGVLGTAWVMYALHESPRTYVRADGPFIAKGLDFLISKQAKDGSIADADAKDAAARLAQTKAAAAALSVHIAPETAAALGKASIWLAGQGIDAPSMDEVDIPESKDDALALALKLLQTRAQDGSFDGAQGKVVETARHIHAMSVLRDILSPEAASATTSIAPLPSFAPATKAEIDAAVLKGARFLLSTGPGARWGAPGRPDAGMTAMVVGSLQAVPEPRPADIQEAIDSALGWIATMQQEDGSIHQGRLANYVTSAAVLALSKSKKYTEVVTKARGFLIRLQADEGEGYSEGDMYYGGIGYGGDERPDLSNLQMALEALVASGSSRNDREIQLALKYLERCQNNSETNDVKVTRKGIVIKSGDDGGAGYAPGESKAGMIELSDGTKVPRSYGSMSYALLKGFVFAGLEKDDPRVEALWRWLSANYTLDINPGFAANADPIAPYQGLFYYFHTMARALDVYGVEKITTPDGVEHDWRAELAGRLVSMQSKADGSWVNRNASRWWEGNPSLATAYALQSLAATRSKD